MFVEDRRTAKTQTHPFSTLSHIYTIHRTEHQTQRERVDKELFHQTNVIFFF